MRYEMRIYVISMVTRFELGYVKWHYPVVRVV